MSLRCKKLKTRLTVKVTGSKAGPGLQGAWGPGPQGLGPAFSLQKPPQITIFRKRPGGNLAKAGVG